MALWWSKRQEPTKKKVYFWKILSAQLSKNGLKAAMTRQSECLGCFVLITNIVYPPCQCQYQYQSQDLIFQSWILESDVRERTRINKEEETKPGQFFFVLLNNEFTFVGCICIYALPGPLPNLIGRHPTNKSISLADNIWWDVFLFSSIQTFSKSNYINK